MAETQTTVVLNIGSQRICVAVFEHSKNGGLILKGYETDTIVADPAFEASRESQIRVALEDIATKLKVTKSKIRYAIPGQAVFMRFVKLPPIQEDNIEQLVTFEAQQHVPFPISEVVWDYELIEGGTEKEVVIVAIKGDALEEINDTVNQAGFTTAEIDVAPMALYNAYRASYGVSEESVLLIDVGAKTSNLLYIEGKRFFTRSVAIGGSSITSAIAKEYHITFAEAEYQKVTNGLVALGGGHTETMDESLAALAMVIRNALSRLPAEIARTTNYYRSQHGGSTPKRVLLAGGGANLPYTLEFFQEKLNLPVDFFNPLSQVTIGKGVDTEVLQRDAHTMGELVGLGLRGIGKSKINIDLVPEAVEMLRAADRRKPFLIAAAAVFIAGMGAFALMKNMAASKTEDQLRTMTEVRDELAPFHARLQKLAKTESELKKVADAYTQVESDHAYWFDILSELRGAFANDAVWLVDFSPLYSVQLVAEGEQRTNMQEVVKADFAGSARDGKSAIAAPPENKAPTGPGAGGRGNPRNVQPAAPTAKAVVVRGYWRQNPKNHNVVYDILKSIKDSSESQKKSNAVPLFDFALPNGKGVLNDEQILKISVTGEEGDLGYPFELILPLARPVVVK